MDPTADVPDSTDWLTTAIPLFAPVESALRCQVCKDFYDTPMITSCAHTFCSFCIRKCLSSDGRCPACREQDQASKLRRNWAVQEVVDAYQGARAQALDTARKAKEAEAEGNGASRRRKRKWHDPGASQERPSKSPRQTRSRSRRSANATASQEAIILDSEDEDEDMEIDEQEVEEDPVDDGLVPCPMCGTRMKEESMWSHLDRCDGTPPSRTAKAK
jgi:E3 ubiquitin-protein ligase RAD18